MAKLHFNYSVMNAGKSTALLSVRHNYIENGSNVMTFTSSIDNRAGVGVIKSRIGIDAPAIALTDDDSILNIVTAENAKNPVSAVLVDEVQFMTARQVSEMSDIVDFLNIPVMAYGLKNNVYGKLFSPAIAEMMALANECNEIKQVCHCGAKATMILKYDSEGNVIRKGEVVEIGDESKYVSVCRPHWKSGNIGPRARNKIFEAGKIVPVICQTCEKKFLPLFEGSSDQAYECASVLKGSEVTGHYGSTVADMSTFRFVNGIPENAKQGVMCDSCISNFILVGDLVEDGYLSDRELEELRKNYNIFYNSREPKIQQAISYVVSNIGKVPLSILNWIFYQADRQHLNNYGRPVLGLKYKAVGQMPQSYELMNIDSVPSYEKWEHSNGLIVPGKNGDICTDMLSGSDKDALIFFAKVPSPYPDHEVTLEMPENWNRPSHHAPWIGYESMLDPRPGMKEALDELADSAPHIVF